MSLACESSEFIAIDCFFLGVTHEAYDIPAEIADKGGIIAMEHGVR
jgi:hypothetical protein